MNPEAIAHLIFDSFAPFTAYVVSLFIGFVLFAAFVVLTVKAFSTNLE
jgi:hypothetical protein